MHDVTVTYDPGDDKIRVYFATRQSDASIAPLKDAGFAWAGAQECWFAHWTPEREDVALSVAGEGAELQDEPTTLADRAEARADRFADYRSNANTEVAAIHRDVSGTLGALNGQPILVGHHSEKRHRRLLERLDAKMRKAWDLASAASYWERRASGSIAWATRKERPDVRARRIKTLEAERRRYDRDRDAMERGRNTFVRGATVELLYVLSNNPHACGLAYGIWERVRVIRDQWTPETADTLRPQLDAIVDDVQEGLARRLVTCERWRDHLAGRIAYERDQLERQGALHLLDPKPRRAGKGAIPLRNIRAGAEPMTSAEWADIHRDYKGSRVVKPEDGSAPYRVRTAIVGRGSARGLSQVFLTDRKES